MLKELEGMSEERDGALPSRVSEDMQGVWRAKVECASAGSESPRRNPIPNSLAVPCPAIRCCLDVHILSLAEPLKRAAIPKRDQPQSSQW